MHSALAPCSLRGDLLTGIFPAQNLGPGNGSKRGYTRWSPRPERQVRYYQMVPEPRQGLIEMMRNKQIDPPRVLISSFLGSFDFSVRPSDMNGLEEKSVSS